MVIIIIITTTYLITTINLCRINKTIVDQRKDFHTDNIKFIGRENFIISKLFITLKKNLNTIQSIYSFALKLPRI